MLYYKNIPFGWFGLNSESPRIEGKAKLGLTVVKVIRISLDDRSEISCASILGNLQFRREFAPCGRPAALGGLLMSFILKIGGVGTWADGSATSAKTVERWEPREAAGIVRHSMTGAKLTEILAATMNMFHT
jgi:hypothetical protein